MNILVFDDFDRLTRLIFFLLDVRFQAYVYTVGTLDVVPFALAYTKSCDLRVIGQLVFVVVFFSFFDIYLF